MKKLFLLFSAALAVAPLALSGQTIMFDFGPTTSTGAETQSPGHASGAIAANLTSWNQVQTTDRTSGLVWANGDNASAITIRTGRESSATSNSIDFLSDPNSSNALGSAINSGIYAGNSPAKDAIWHGSDNFAVGVQITGLAAGTYEIYVSGRNTNVGTTYATNFYGTASAAGDTFEFGSIAASSVSNPGTTGWTDWTEGATYAVLTITLTEGQVLNLAAQGAGTGASGRGFLNSVQIVSVIPEPSSYAALTGLGAIAFMALRRRRR